MATDARWRRISWPAMLALALAAGSAAAQEIEEVPPDAGGEDVVYEDVGYLDEEPVPVDSTCDGCETEWVVSHYGGELAEEPGATTVARRADATSGDEDHDEWRFGRSPGRSNACSVPELYVAWLCQAYPQP